MCCIVVRAEIWRIAGSSRAQSSRLAEFGGLGMSFNICRGTLGNLAMFTARIFAGWPLGQLRNQAVTTGAQTAAYCSAIVAESV
jgi:hypothetical protein